MSLICINNVLIFIRSGKHSGFDLPYHFNSKGYSSHLEGRFQFSVWLDQVHFGIAVSTNFVRNKSGAGLLFNEGKFILFRDDRQKLVCQRPCRLQAP